MHTHAYTHTDILYLSPIYFLTFSSVFCCPRISDSFSTRPHLFPKYFLFVSFLYNFFSACLPACLVPVGLLVLFPSCFSGLSVCPPFVLVHHFFPGMIPGILELSLPLSRIGLLLPDLPICVFLVVPHLFPTCPRFCLRVRMGRKLGVCPAHKFCPRCCWVAKLGLVKQ